MSSFYINRTRIVWRVVEEAYQNGKRKQLTVPRLAYSVLGLRPETTLEEARVRITEYNKTKKLQTAVGAAKRYVENIKIKSAFLNVTKTQEFSRYLENYHFGSAKLEDLRKENLLYLFWTNKKLYPALDRISGFNQDDGALNSVIQFWRILARSGIKNF